MDIIFMAIYFLIPTPIVSRWKNWIHKTASFPKMSWNWSLIRYQIIYKNVFHLNLIILRSESCDFSYSLRRSPNRPISVQKAVLGLTSFGMQLTVTVHVLKGWITSISRKVYQIDILKKIDENKIGFIRVISNCCSCCRTGPKQTWRC